MLNPFQIINIDEDAIYSIDQSEANYNSAINHIANFYAVNSAIIKAAQFETYRSQYSALNECEIFISSGTMMQIKNPDYEQFINGAKVILNMKTPAKITLFR